MTMRKNISCTSPAAWCYWAVVSLVAWGALSIIGIYWQPLQASSAARCLLAAAVGCAANWFRHRSLHCAITAPIFLIGGVVFLLSDARVIRVRDSEVWPFVIIGTGIAFLLEWRYARHVEC